MRLLVGTHAALVVVTALFLASTWFARDFINGQARQFVTDKTLEYSRPIVSIGEGLLDAPFVEKKIGKEKLDAAREEVDRYNRDPRAYIEQLTGQRPLPEAIAKNGPLPDRVVQMKQSIVEYYEGMLDDLIKDLRIFGVSNLAAAATALGLSILGGPNRTIAAITVAIGCAILSMAYLYIDGMTFFKIFTRSHMGLAYPTLLVITCVYGIYSYQRARNEGMLVSPKQSEESSA